ncbi:MAG: sigma 54-interacting transcriptional regulator [Deltaproteobacteria bacterium]|nr:sigma 54-interacting transcriptional regulator [Deltaproteobacteria bacterium]
MWGDIAVCDDTGLSYLQSCPRIVTCDKSGGPEGKRAVVDRSEFFRQMTLRICSSLDIEAALRKAFEYLRAEFSIDELFLDILDANLGALRRLAQVSEDPKLRPREILPLPEGLWSWVREKRRPFVVDPRDASSQIRALAPIVDLAGNSDAVLPLRIQGELLGTLVLRVHGKGKFTSEHLELLASVAEPFAIALANALAHEDLARYKDLLLDDNRFLSKELRGEVLGEMIGSEGGLRDVMTMVGQVAPLQNTVLLLGETGAGKEVVANAIHHASPRKDGPFIKVNCGAIPETLLDSELFGHERGAFTGATAEKRGRFERASGGTIFLDEVGELPLSAQVRLLRVLQNREIERVGGDKPLPVDIRVIAATHRNLESMVEAKQFREDLWFRLNVFPIVIPPLRHRIGDIPALARHFVARKSRELGIGAPPPIAPGALDRLVSYAWPGNVRELENLIERELITSREGPLLFDSLQARGSAEQAPARKATKALNGPTRLDDVIAAHIRSVLKATQGKVHGPGGAADVLGVNGSTLRARMRKLGIQFGRKAKRVGARANWS